MLFEQFARLSCNGHHTSNQARLLLKIPTNFLSLNEQQELEALGLLLQLCVPPIIALILMLLEVSECSSPLGLVLQKR